MIRWGILGTGRIAGEFAQGLHVPPDARLEAVGSRTAAAAAAFAEQHGVSRQHSSYKSLAADPDIDIIYIATPHQLHKPAALLCLQHGKAVLCEKPFALTATEAVEMAAAARERELFLMEAMWTRFTPAMIEIRSLIESGAIGEIRMVSADLGFRAEPGKPHRLFDPAYGGGALLDVGVYVVSFASMVLGAPSRLSAHASNGASEVDEQMAAILEYPNGALAVLSAAIRTDTPHVASVMGTEGRIDIHHDWHKPRTFTLTRTRNGATEFSFRWEGNGYNYEAAEAGRCLVNGLLESPVMPLDETIGIMRTLDQIRSALERHAGSIATKSCPAGELQ